MKKQEIKADPIRDRIVASAQYLSENSQKVWLGLGVVGVLILLMTLYSNNKRNKMLENNLTMGMLQNKAIYNTEYSDSLLNSEFEAVLNNMDASESYNQAFIYLLNNAINNSDIDKIESLLDNNKFSSNDDMLNGFIYKVKADISLEKDIDAAAKHYKKAIKIVPNYDLKVSYSIDLIDLYINDSKLDQANKTLENIKQLVEDVDNLPRDAKNNLDFIEYRLKQLNN